MGEWATDPVKDWLRDPANASSPTPPASPSVVADKPDAGEVTQAQLIGIPDLPAPAATFHSVRYFSVRQMEDYGLAAHEAGRREGLGLLRDETCVVFKRKGLGSYDTVICGQSIVEGYLRQGYEFDWEATDKARAKEITTAIRALSQQDRGEGK